MYSQINNLHSNVKVRLLVSFLTKLHTTALVSLLPIFFRENLSVIYVSLVMTLIIFSSIFGKFVGGALGDKFSRKKLLLNLNSLEIINFLLLILFLVFNINYIILILLFNINAILSSSKGPVIDSMVIDSVNKEERSIVFFINYWLMNISLSLGFLLVGFVFNGNMFNLILFGTICHIISAFCIYKFFVEINVNSGISVDKRILSLKGYKEIFKDNRFLIFCLGTILIVGLEFQLTNHIAIHLNDNFHAYIFNYSIDGIKMLGLLQLVNSLIAVLIPLFIGKILDVNKVKIYMIGVLLYSAGYSLLTLTNNFYLLIGLALIFSIGEVLYYPYKQLQMAELLTKENQTKYLAVNQLTIHLSRLLGPIGILIFSIINIYIGSFIMFMLGIFGGGLIFISNRRKN